MKTYKHVTSGELAELFSENTKAVILKFEDGTKKGSSANYFPPLVETCRGQTRRNSVRSDYRG